MHYYWCTPCGGCCNGTVALRLALHLVGVAKAKSVASVELCGDSQCGCSPRSFPSLCGCGAKRLGLCPNALAVCWRASLRDARHLFNRKQAVVSLRYCLHVFGHPAEVDQLRSVADTWGLPLIEDAAEALGSWRAGIHCGLFGEVGTLSFNGNKLITTGGGGALLTNDADLAKRARHLSTTAKLPHPWAFNHDAWAGMIVFPTSMLHLVLPS